MNECPHLEKINLPDAGNVCLDCGVVIFEIMIEPEPERNIVIRMNISNIFGSKFQNWSDFQCNNAEQIYLKLSNGIIFKGRFRTAINLVVEYLINSKAVRFP